MIDIVHLSITGFALTELKAKKMIHPFLNVWLQLWSWENNFKEGVGVKDWRKAREGSGMLRPSRWPQTQHKTSFFSESLNKATILQQTCSFALKYPELSPHHFPPEPPLSFIKCTVTVCYSWNYGLTSTQELVLSSLQRTTPTEERKMESLTDSVSPVYPTQQRLSVPLKWQPTAELCKTTEAGKGDANFSYYQMKAGSLANSHFKKMLKFKVHLVCSKTGLGIDNKLRGPLVWSKHVFPVFTWHFPHIRQTGNSKLPQRVIAWANVCALQWTG